jgi:hypothetical protein
MKIDRDAYTEKSKLEGTKLSYPYAFGIMKAHFEGLIEKVEMGDNPLAKEYLEKLREDGFIESN